MNKTVIRQALESFLGKARVKNDALQFHYFLTEKKRDNMGIMKNELIEKLIEDEKTSLSGMLNKTEVKTPIVKKITKDIM